MARSTEYPDLPWIEPRSWTNANRTAVQLVVIHTTEGSAQGESAEDGAAYDQRRTDGTSTHYFHDSNSTVQCVRTEDQAHTARAQGNRRGVHHELCTRAGSANWADAYHQAMLARVAKQAARDARKWDIPVRHLTVAQVDAGAKGFCGHWDVTRAFPEDGGTHTDPGANFPWTQFLDMVRAELAGKPAAEEIDVALGTDKIKLSAGAAKELGGDYKAGSEITGETALNLMLIYAARADDKAAAATAAALAAAASAKATEEWLSKLNSPASSPEQTAALLHAVLGVQSNDVGRILATYED